MIAAASASRLRAPAWSGCRVRISAAPRAAKAVARRWGDRRPALRSKCARANAAAPESRGNRAAAVPSPQSARPQQSSSDGSSIQRSSKIAPVVEAAVGCLGVGHQPQVEVGQRHELFARLLLPGQDDQTAGDVVDAIPVLGTWFGEPGVLEQPAVVAEPEEVGERHRRPDQRPVGGRPAHALASAASDRVTANATWR